MPDSSAVSASARHPAVAFAVAGVLMILTSAIVRLTPMAVLPLMQLNLTPFEWLLYASSCVFFGYFEGYKAFQLKFSPMCVERALTLSSPNSVWLHRALAPFYAMGLLHASRKRLITSWCISLFVSFLVVLVRRLPYPQRSIVDIGVVIGLAWGAIAISVYYGRSLVGHGAPGVDPQLPVGNSSCAARTSTKEGEGYTTVGQPLQCAELEASPADEELDATPSTEEIMIGLQPQAARHEDTHNV
jgi:hypothetical protein